MMLRRVLDWISDRPLIRCWRTRIVVTDTMTGEQWDLEDAGWRKGTLTHKHFPPHDTLVEQEAERLSELRNV